MKAILKQVEGCFFAGKADSNHWTAVDTSEETCGFNAATHPMELLLISLGSCVGSDIAYILKKKRLKYDRFEINMDADRAKSHPKVFTHVHMEYVLYGKDLNPLHVEQAISLSKEKYCPVQAMLKNAVSITTSYKIINDDNK